MPGRNWARIDVSRITVRTVCRQVRPQSWIKGAMPSVTPSSMTVHRLLPQAGMSLALTCGEERAEDEPSIQVTKTVSALKVS